METTKPEPRLLRTYEEARLLLEARGHGRHGLVNPIEALLHHEVIGHILPVLRDSELLRRIKASLRLKQENERGAVQQENEYRAYVGLPLEEEVIWLYSE